MNGLKTAKNAVFTLIVLGLLSTNVLLVTSAKFHDLLYGALSNFPYESLFSNSKSKQYQLLAEENDRLKKKNAKLEQQAASRRMKIARAKTLSRNITKRTARNVALNVSSVAVEAIPYLGIGMIVSVTIADVAAGCQNVRDTNEILSILDEAPLEEMERKVCGASVPSVDQLKAKIDDVQRSLGDAIGGTIYEILH
ncbi:hypothetical protein [Marinobacter flavimaris]|uniref:hypothetical protein n=1 Tax=Marinobacter flavimaris TaxID=262076 RepID=UPI00386F1D0F|nr:hypothetical protein [Marinobacter sp.]MCW9007381.1 hypothetical protein [Marinobacter sp.]